MKEFDNKVAVITGAASGIGLATAKVLADEGMHLVLLDNRPDELTQAQRELTGKGVNVLGIETDVSDANAVDSAAKKVISELGTIHCLVNNAAVFYRGSAIADVDEDVWNWLLNVNLHGTLNCIRAFLPLILAHGEEGHVVTTASISGFIVRDRKNGVYATSKFALVGLSEALVHDLKNTPVNVSVVLPAAVSSDFYLSSAQHRGDLGGPNLFAETPEDTANGMSPDEVAARLLDGVRENRFYIATHPSTRDMLNEKHSELMAAYDAADNFSFNPEQ